MGPLRNLAVGSQSRDTSRPSDPAGKHISNYLDFNPVPLVHIELALDTRQRIVEGAAMHDVEVQTAIFKPVAISVVEIPIPKCEL